MDISKSGCIKPKLTAQLEIIKVNGLQSGVWGFQGVPRKKGGLFIFTVILSNTMSECMTIFVMGFIHFLSST